MPYKVEPAQRITRLQRALEAKLRALRVLEQERAQLHLKHTLLTSTCEVLSILRHCKAAQTGAASVEQQSDLETNEELQQLNLLQQLDCISNTSVTSSTPQPHTLSHSSNSSSDTSSIHSNLQASNSSEAETDGLWCTDRDFHSTIAPADDPLYFLRGLMLQPYFSYGSGCGPFSQDPVPHPAVITLKELQNYYNTNTKQISTHMGFLEQANLMTDIAVGSDGSSSSIPAGLIQHAEAVKQLLFRYLLLINDIVLYDNMNVLVPFYINNVVTNAEADHKTDMYLESLQQMNITQQQQDNILTLYDFYVRLYGSVTAQRAQMQQNDRQRQQQQQQQQDDWEINSGGSSSSTAVQSDLHSSNSSNSSSSFFEVQKSVQQQQRQSWQQRQQRQQYLHTMDINMGKELIIVHLAAFTLWGSLSWWQAAKMIIACYPFAANPIVLAAELKELRQQQQQEQQQQRKGRNGGGRRRC